MQTKLANSVCPKCFKGEHEGCLTGEALYAEQYHGIAYPPVVCPCYFDDMLNHQKMAKERLVYLEILLQSIEQECSCLHCEPERING